MCCAELEDRLRTAQSQGGIGSANARLVGILFSMGAKGISEQPVCLPSHPWRKHKVGEGKLKHLESERFRSEKAREMEGGLRYARSRFTCIVKMMAGLVSLACHSIIES